MEGGRMPYKWPSDTDFALRELDFLDPVLVRPVGE